MHEIKAAGHYGLPSKNWPLPFLSFISFLLTSKLSDSKGCSLSWWPIRKKGRLIGCWRQGSWALWLTLKEMGSLSFLFFSFCINVRRRWKCILVVPWSSNKKHKQRFVIAASPSEWTPKSVEVPHKDVLLERLCLYFSSVMLMMVWIMSLLNIRRRFSEWWFSDIRGGCLQQDMRKVAAWSGQWNVSFSQWSAQWKVPWSGQWKVSFSQCSGQWKVPWLGQWKVSWSGQRKVSFSQWSDQWKVPCSGQWKVPFCRERIKKCYYTCPLANQKG